MQLTSLCPAIFITSFLADRLLACTVSDHSGSLLGQAIGKKVGLIIWYRCRETEKGTEDETPKQ